MRGFGRFATYPRRLGGGIRRQEIILQGLQTDNGTAYSTDDDSPHYVEDLATARALSAVWGTNQRLGSLWDPYRMPSEMLPRWERIFALGPAPNATELSRRKALARVLGNFGEPSDNGRIVELLEEELGDVFVAVEYIDSTTATITVPDGSWPFGIVSPFSPWSSTVCQLLIRTQVPTGMSESEFQATVAKIVPLLDPILPAFVTVTWYRPGPVSVDLPGGASAAGFYLDDEHNLDNELLAS